MDSIKNIFLCIGVFLLCVLGFLNKNYVNQPACSTTFSEVDATSVNVTIIQITNTIHGEVWEIDVYLYSSKEETITSYFKKNATKRYMLETATKRHTAIVNISSNDECIGPRFLQPIIRHLIGYQTIVTQSVLYELGPGYLYNFKTNKLYKIDYARPRGPSSIDYALGVFLTSLMMFAIWRIPEACLSLSLATLGPTLMAMGFGIFLLNHLFDDDVLGTGVWLVLWSCRLIDDSLSDSSQQYLRKWSFLILTAFHVYILSYKSGFTYIAFLTISSFYIHVWTTSFFHIIYEIEDLDLRF